MKTHIIFRHLISYNDFYLFAGTDPSCVSDPCQNGGSCHPDGFGGHGCTCFGDYYGRDCEIYHTPGRYRVNRHATIALFL